MSNTYDTFLKEIKRDIISQKNIYKFRTFLYSLNKPVRQKCFDICKRYLDNEYDNNIEITFTEKQRLLNLRNHWQWPNFESNSTDWWYILTEIHSHSISLMDIINLWINDIEIFDENEFETSTNGLS